MFLINLEKEIFRLRMIKKETLMKDCFKELQRYSDSTLIVTTFSDLIEKNPELGNIEFIEKELKIVDKESKNLIANSSNGDLLDKSKSKIKILKKVEVDLLIKNNGFDVVEFKTSVSNHENELDNTIKQILERDNDLMSDLEVLETKNIIFLCHKDDSKVILDHIDKRKKINLI
jgi:hypothetical protein